MGFYSMKSGVDFKELKDIEKRILKGIKLQNSFNSLKTVAAFDLAYKDNRYFCVAIVLDIETKKEIEKKQVSGDEIMPYSPNLIAFREGPVIMDAYRELDNKPDVLIVKGMGALHPRKVGLASYIGVITNKPCIGIAKELIYGRLDEDKVLFGNDLKGRAIRSKEFANPFYVVPGHNIDLDTSIEVVKSLIDDNYKLPLPLHLAHKYVNKLKQD